MSTAGPVASCCPWLARACRRLRLLLMGGVTRLRQWVVNSYITRFQSKMGGQVARLPCAHGYYEDCLLCRIDNIVNWQPPTLLSPLSSSVLLLSQDAGQSRAEHESSTSTSSGSDDDSSTEGQDEDEPPLLASSSGSESDAPV